MRKAMVVLSLLLANRCGFGSDKSGRGRACVVLIFGMHGRADVNKGNQFDLGFFFVH
jgi:hypothetical protein